MVVAYVEENLDQLLRGNDHLSLYLLPFTDKCRVNTWNRTDCKQTPLGNIKESTTISWDALQAAWGGNLFAYTGRLPQADRAYGFNQGSDLVLESNEAFNRTIYHLHQELEFTVSFEDTFEVCRRLKELYEELYPSGLPYTLFEVRFTPDGHDRTLIGAGRDRRSTWIDLVCNDSRGFERYYAAAQDLIKEIGARPHLRKFCTAFGKADLAKLHWENFTKFLNLVEEHDPNRKFANEFTRRLFGR